MRSLRDPRRPYLPAIHEPMDAVYWGSAILAGISIGFDVPPQPLQFVFVVGIAIAMTVVGRGIEGGMDNHRPTSWLWALIFSVVWLSIAFARRSFPFGP